MSELNQKMENRQRNNVLNKLKSKIGQSLRDEFKSVNRKLSIADGINVDEDEDEEEADGRTKDTEKTIELMTQEFKSFGRQNSREITNFMNTVS